MLFLRAPTAPPAGLTFPSAACLQPSGSGHYAWADGSCYDGEWLRGTKHGRGRYAWPSGASYDGEWMDGYMQGVGAYSAPDNTRYEGSWLRDLKHGLGRKDYPNGDTVEGLWRNGIAEGPGRYQWADGSEYSGEWHGGEMHGHGTFVWANGDRYDGRWRDSQEHGRGIFTWADSSVYDGEWREGVKHGRGIFYPAGVGPNKAQRSRDARARREAHSERRASAGAGVARGAGSGAGGGSDGGAQPTSDSDVGGVTSDGGNFSTDDEHGDESSGRAAGVLLGAGSEGGAASMPQHHPRPNVTEIGGGEAPRCVMVREYSQGTLVSEQSQELPRHLPRRRRKKDKRLLYSSLSGNERLGETVFKGHRSYELMVNLQLGIRHSVGRVSARGVREIVREDFDAKIEVRFPRAGGPTTPPHSSIDFKWKDYCPAVFHELRRIFGVDLSDYMLSVCGDQALSQMGSPGKSGSVFFISHDDRFIIKTMRKHECKLLMEMLPKYHAHVRKHPQTMLTRFLGMYRVKPTGGRNVRFVVMGNLFCTDLRIHRRYDLKGSTQGRITDPGKKVKETTILKDLDLNVVFKMEATWREKLVQQMARDCKLLEECKVMDYSLLLGVHYRDTVAADATDDVKEEADGDMREGEGSRHGDFAGVEPSFSNEIASSVERVLELGAGRKEATQLARGTIGNMSAKSGANGVESRALPQKELVKVVTTRPQRSHTLRPLPGADGGTDALAMAFGRGRVELGVNMAAVAVPPDHKPSANGVGADADPAVRDCVLYFGIIDFLQEYNAQKKAENLFKSAIHDGDTISAVDPVRYSHRFQDFMRDKFV